MTKVVKRITKAPSDNEAYVLVDEPKQSRLDPAIELCGEMINVSPLEWHGIHAAEIRELLLEEKAEREKCRHTLGPDNHCIACKASR